jgi:two-component system sensor kinase FixL
LLKYSTDAIFCYEYDPPIPTDISVDEQIPLFYEGILVECNEKAARSYHAENPADVIGKSIKELFIAESGELDGFYEMFIKNNYQAVGLEAEEVLLDGSKRRYQNNGYGVVEDGLLKRVWGTYQDITGRIQSDKLIRIQRDLGLALISIRSLEETLDLCLESAIQVANLDSGGIYLFDEDGGMNLVCSSGLPEEFVRVSKYFDPETPNVELIKTGKPIYSQHQDLEIDIDGPRKQEGLKGIGIIPIAYKDEIIACLNVASHTINEVPEYTRDSLEIIANQIGNAIARSRTESELDTHRENLEAIVAERSKDLYESEARLRAFVNAVPDLIFILDENGLYVDVFTAEENLLFNESSALKGKYLKEVLPPEPAAEFLSVIKQTIKTNQNQKYDYSLMVQDGLKWFEGQTAPISLPEPNEGEAKMIVWVSRDITERKKAEEIIQNNEAKFRGIVENSPLGIIAVDTKSAIIEVNNAFCKLLGYTEEELLGKTVQELTHPEDLLNAGKVIKEKINKKEEAYSHEIRLIKKNNQVIWVNLSSTVIFDNNGSPLMGLSVVEDITKKISVMKALEKTTEELARSNEELEQFAYVASHDLQEPLRKISTFSARLQERYHSKLDGQGMDYLDRMKNASVRGQRLINDLLDLSRVTTQGKPFAAVNLNNILADVLVNLEVTLQEVEGIVETEPLPTIQGDPTQMNQLFQNLISNSLKFRKKDISPKIHISVNDSKNGLIEIALKDNGIGFEMEYLDRIFQPFQRLHGINEYEGSGIGLSLCRKIVERHGGSLNANSKPGQGAIFIISLPKDGKENGSLEKLPTQEGIRE